MTEYSVGYNVVCDMALPKAVMLCNVMLCYVILCYKWQICGNGWSPGHETTFTVHFTSIMWCMSEYRILAWFDVIVLNMNEYY